MDDLVTWRRAQLDEDERLAAGLEYWAGYIEQTQMGDSAGEAAYLRRVLRKVAAARRLIDLYEAARGRYLALADARARSLAPTKPEPSDEERRAMDMADAYAQAVKLSALPLADRPGYREEWRP